MRNKPLPIVWMLIFVLLAGSMKNSLILNFYLLDNKDFTALFCENNKQTQSNCNGGCQISKMADSKDSNELPAIFEQLRSELVYFAVEFSYDVPEVQVEVIHNYFYSDNYQSVDLIKFTPPPVLI